MENKKKSDKASLQNRI